MPLDLSTIKYCENPNFDHSVPVRHVDPLVQYVSSDETDNVRDEGKSISNNNGI